MNFSVIKIFDKNILITDNHMKVDLFAECEWIR